VTFKVIAGPNLNDMGTDMTDASGMASFTYLGDGGAGIDLIEGTFLDTATMVTRADTVMKEWISVARPDTLFGIDGDNSMLIRVAVTDVSPSVVVLGTVVNGSGPIEDPEAMTWDPVLGRILIVSNEDEGPLYMIDPADIPDPPPADIPATFIGNTDSDDIEGIAVNPVSGELFGVDNTSHKLVKISTVDGAVTEIGDLGFKDVEGLTFTLSPDTVLFATDTRSGKLITIDTNTGAGTPVHPTNLIGFPNVEGLAFASDSTLFGFSNSTIDEFITINTSSGIGTIFSTTGSQGLDIEGLTFMRPDSLLTASSASITTTIDTPPSVPKLYALDQNYPNPFNPTTNIRFTIAAQLTDGTFVRLSVYNILGGLVRTLVEQKFNPGQYVVQWDGRNDQGDSVPSGIYIYQLVSGDLKETKQMILLK
jgi:hypothetical protein